MKSNFGGSNMSLKRIAEEIGVSKATVSWVLSGQGDSKGISAATQKRVRDFAAKHNYQPDMIARSLSLGVTKTLGLLISSLSDPFYSSIAKSVVAEAEKSGYTVMIASSESNVEREVKLMDMLKRRRVDGVIVTPTQSAHWVDSFTSGGGKIVMVDRPVMDSNTPFVVVDNEESSYRLVSHLLSKGLRRIAIVTTAHNLTNMRARYAGYVRALKEAGIEPEDRLMCQVPPAATREQINEALDHLKNDGGGVDGIFFTSHVLVMPAYVHIRDHGYSPGKGETWACIHSLPELDVLLPGMSIAKMPIDELGFRAVDLLLNTISAPADEPQPNVVLNCEMLLR